jgi:hypothetical protein
MRWYQEPFLHFIVLGSILFFLIDSNNQENSRELIVTKRDISTVLERWHKSHQSDPSKRELDELLKEYKEDEILYQEALLKEFDKNDLRIRNILINKLKYSLSEPLDISKVTDEVLKEYFEKKKKFFNKDQIRLTFGHIYLNPQKHKQIDKLARRLLKEVEGLPYRKKLSLMGDPFYAGSLFQNLSKRELTKSFSHAFVKDLATLSKREWSLLKSGYGIHLIYIIDKVQEEVKFNDVKEQVKDRYIIEKDRDAYKYFYQSVKDNYKIVIKNDNGS